MKLSRLFAPAGVLTLLLAADAAAQVVKPQSPWPRRRARLSCTPRRLYRGDTLTLRMSVPHGGDLAVVAPDGTFFFVVYWKPDQNSPSPATRPLMDWEEFKRLARLELPTGSAEATPWVHGRDRNELIFTRTGWYTVRLSENLETDDGTPFSECRVYYAHRPPPGAR